MDNNYSNKINRIEMRAIAGNYGHFMDFIEAELDSFRIDTRVKSRIMTAAEEIVVNILKYAYVGEAKNLQVVIKPASDQLELTFIDEGIPFNPLEKPDTDITLSAEERDIGGLGILIVKKLMDDVVYEHREDKNYLTLIKRLP